MTNVRIEMTLFEGGHEMIPDRILDGVKGKRIPVTGDSVGTDRVNRTVRE